MTRAVRLDSGYPHDSNQCIILRLQLSFMMINMQLIIDACLIDIILFFGICSIQWPINSVTRFSFRSFYAYHACDRGTLYRRSIV